MILMLVRRNTVSDSVGARACPQLGPAGQKMVAMISGACVHFARASEPTVPFRLSVRTSCY
jgi:hypothetical protein